MSDANSKAQNPSISQKVTRLQFTFARDLSDDDIKKLQSVTDALEIAQADEGHHDHDHPTINAVVSREQ